jgi:aubergine-like protein
VSNNSNFSEETIWQLTYWQCYNYSNWAGPVRVPAVCQYAHKVAYAYGDTLKKDVKPTLLGTLY